MKIDDIAPVKGNLTYFAWSAKPLPYIEVDCEILVDGQPFDENSIPDLDVLINRLDLNSLSVKINGNTAQLESTRHLHFFYPVNLGSEIDVTAKCGTNELSERFTLTQIQYDMNTIISGASSRFPEIEHPDVTIQQATENYALVISGFIFLRTHLGELKAKFDSQEDWCNWLYYTFYNANSYTDAINNFTSYVSFDVKSIA